MTMTVVGLKRKNGVFKEKPYDNYFLEILIEDNGSSALIAGGEFSELKMKAYDFNMAFARNVQALNNPNIRDLKDIVGLRIAPGYPIYPGVITDFSLAVPEKKK